jgi:hypothetical protein
VYVYAGVCMCVSGRVIFNVCQLLSERTRQDLSGHAQTVLLERERERRSRIRESGETIKGDPHEVRIHSTVCSHRGQTLLS